MKTLPLTKGKVALVDDVDFEYLSQWKWRAIIAKRKHVGDVWYAYRSTPRPNRRSIIMHREVMRLAGFPEAPQVDHVDANGLNNQRYNLRAATASQNRWGMRKRSGCTSRFKGVYWHKKSQSWMARLYHKAKHHFLGCFENEEAAGRAYDAAAKIKYGEFARLNFL